MDGSGVSRHQARDARAARPAPAVLRDVVHGGHPVQPQDVLRDLDQDRAARRERQDSRYRRQRREPHRGEEPQRREHQKVADDLARALAGPRPDRDQVERKG